MRSLAVPVLLALALVPAGGRAQPAVAPRTRVAVAAHALARGVVLSAQDIDWIDGAAVRGAARDGDAAVAPGWITRRVIAAGEPLRAPAIAPPPVVRANELVDLVVQRGGAQLTLRGRAARDAAAGERVTVRVDAARRFDGIAEAPGRVRLP